MRRLRALGEKMNEDVKQIVDVAAGSVTVLTLVNVLPAIAAAFAIVWTAIRIWEAVMGRPFSESWIARKLRGDDGS
jgi:hypothetical protein